MKLRFAGALALALGTTGIAAADQAAMVSPRAGTALACQPVSSA